jgi:hypothetical protein
MTGIFLFPKTGFFYCGRGKSAELLIVSEKEKSLPFQTPMGLAENSHDY